MLREQAREIWEAGVAAVSSERLVRNVIVCDGRTLSICGRDFEIAAQKRVQLLAANQGRLSEVL